MKDLDDSRRIEILGAIAYAAPVAGSWFFYIPMWSILPAIYGKYFGVPMVSIAAAVLLMRLFDGMVDTVVGYSSDWHKSRGGSRKSWAVIGGLGCIAACSFLFNPPRHTTVTYYLLASIAFFLAFTIIEIPHLTWGSELATEYSKRARIYGIRSLLQRAGIIVFYILPLLPIYPSYDYTPEVLHDAVYIGGLIIVVGLFLMLRFASAGEAHERGESETFGAVVSSIIRNRPLQIYFSALACVGLCCGMWYGLVYLYLDSYLLLGTRVATMFLVATILAAVSTPGWLAVIGKLGKSNSWAVAIVLFILQLAITWFAKPGGGWLLPFIAVVLANLSFCCYDVAAISILGDIVDYGRMRFGSDHGTTYFALNLLIFKIGLGVGGGMALGIAGKLGFVPADVMHSATAVFGLKLGFILLPACCAVLGVLLVVQLPINRRRHGIILRRLQSRLTGTVHTKQLAPLSYNAEREM